MFTHESSIPMSPSWIFRFLHEIMAVRPNHMVLSRKKKLNERERVRKKKKIE